ncbi:DNA internalization-related competence protein ComEC/Rec2 [Solibacillus merdavium]|uniref:DNA internalization-related competence protein ComEC/Rec2 n=1 Tax=Solibacillus merdavium TaxID=2762218 RepID=A0ABR8XJE1_9BACL|nr:DNA internalization-related competence protein ComEC/Rec2 [Solibacillus merdavium]MBD8032049.1 DNA internalization-related competence protein ComEC/Rec2 [Solibacillus merdavium]
MLYLVNLFKHNWIFYALSICISAGAALESVRLLALLVILLLFCHYKQLLKIHLVFVFFTGIGSYLLFSYEVNKLSVSVELPAILTWSDEYRINGVMLRGFMTNAEGEKLYVTYEIKSEQEKQLLEAQQLAGSNFFVVGEQVSPSVPAHRYGFSMAQYLQSKNARGIIEIHQLTFVGKGNSFLQPLYDQRFRLKLHIEETFPPSLVAEAQALLIGLQHNVDDELNRAYQKLGITHLFAISGLHVALVSFLFFQLLLRMSIRRESATILLLAILPMYAIVAGGAPSIWRAVSVVEFIMLARYFRWNIPMDDALSLSFIIFVLLEPGVIFQVGFQLSYLATYSLVYSSRILARYSNFWIQSFFITFVCQILVYPLLLFHFFEISLSSFIANIFFVPLFSFVILPINLAVLVLTFLPLPFDSFVFLLYEPLRTALTNFIFIIQQPIIQMWNPGKPSILWLVFLYSSVFITFYLLDKQSTLKAILLLVLPAIVFHFQSYWDGDLKISFVNVGQGDCIVIELPYRKSVIVIDAGGLLRFDQEKWKERQTPYEVGRQIVVPYLKGRGIQSIDTFVLSHADADHVEGAEEVLREVIVKEVHVTPGSISKPVMNDFLQELKKTNTKLIEKMAGDYWKVGATTFEYLWPADIEYEGNNDSLVIMVTHNQYKALFTGDLEKEGEQQLIQLYTEKLRNIDLLKAGHHGSKTSSIEEFVALTNPKFAVFMAGENNRYNHPHIDVVNRFESYHIPHATTGLEGTIEVTITKGEITIEKSNSIYLK